MSSIGLGNDILEIDRFKKAYERYKIAFLKKIFTEEEIKYCFRYKNFIIHFAGKFSAKEAVVKALGIGFGKKISFTDIEILNEKNGRPFVSFSKKIKKNFKNPKILISISHSKKFAMAVAILLN
ncbi:MAG: 4'-phosphopantetheinyl transferase [Chlamydiae bacterium SM23_39]|nr:MAG: 4'-phosphopantetheinyl transferase [Chlamydiae bacterium SM23_39]